MLEIGMVGETVVDDALRFKKEFGAGTWVCVGRRQRDLPARRESEMLPLANSSRNEKKGERNRLHFLMRSTFHSRGFILSAQPFL
jgi:hypothetical protein